MYVLLLVYLLASLLSTSEEARILTVPAPPSSHVWYFNIISEHLTDLGHQVDMVVPEGVSSKVRIWQLSAADLVGYRERGVWRGSNQERFGGTWKTMEKKGECCWYGKIVNEGFSCEAWGEGSNKRVLVWHSEKKRSSNGNVEQASLNCD